MNLLDVVMACLDVDEDGAGWVPEDEWWKNDAIEDLEKSWLDESEDTEPVEYCTNEWKKFQEEEGR